VSVSPGPVRWRVLFSGRVQGVGFRYTTVRISGGYAVRGYVRNLPDGRVELVAEGTRSELERFVEAIREAMSGNIQGEQKEECPATGEFRAFDIRV